MRHGFTRHTTTNNEVKIGSDGVIYLSFAGPQTEATTSPIYEQTKKLIAEQRAAGKRVLMFGDVTKITTQDSGSRVNAKRLMSLDFDANAVYGTSKLMPIIMYVMRSGKYSHVRAFRSKKTAMRWLHGNDHSTSNGWPPFINGVLIALGVLNLIGWIKHISILQHFYPTFPIIRPLAAIALITLGVASIAGYFGKTRVRVIFSVIAGIIGMCMLAPHMLPAWLRGGEDQTIPAVTAWSFMLCSLLSGFWGARHKQIKPLALGIMVIVTLLAAANSVAYIYSHAFLFSLGHYFIASPMLSICFMAYIFAHGLFQQRTKASLVLSQTSWISIGIIAVILGVQLLTALSWRSTSDNARRTAYTAFNEQINASGKAIADRLQTYVNALYGFRGLFNSSDQVTEGDFSRYYSSLDLQKRYPGFRAISFIQSVNVKEIPATVQEARNDRSLYPEGNPNFTTPQSYSEYFMVRYVANGRGTGQNLALDPTRRAIFQQARDSGEPSASGTIDFAASATQKASRGFIITIPIYKSPAVPTTIEARRTQHVGFVNAVFNYDTLFANALTSVPDFSIQIYDADGMNANTRPFFSTTAVNQPDDSRLFTKQSTLYAAGRPWQISAQAPKDFGGDKSQESLALTILYAGNALALVLLFVLWLEMQGRRRAMRLADAMTQDLNAERNNAIALQHKDEALLSSIGDGVFALDMDGHIILFNKAAASITGFSSDDVLGERYSDALHFINESTAAIEISFIEKALKGKLGGMSKHTAIIHKSGHRVPVADSAAPIIDAQGKQIGAIVVFRDVTHERQLEQAKDEFVSLVSHQLRTPLTAMRLFVEMLLGEQVGKLNEPQRDYLSKVEVSTQRMIQLVGDFLNTSRIELGRLKVEPVPTKLNELVASHIDEVKPLADAKGITIAYTAKDMPEVSVDQSLYGQVVHNLLTNAIRYTPTGGKVTVTVHKSTHGFQLDVSDTGIGIPKEAQAKLFQRFFRADNAIKVEGEGSGLGLYLIKKIVELSKGKIWFESEQSKGTTFHVIIPEEGMKAKAGAASLK